MTKPRACVMGHPVAHSRSPMLHGYWLRTLGVDGAYEFADVPPEKFEGFFRGLKANGFVGGNITQPHKQQAFRLVDRREPAADAIGAVNTVWYEDGRLIGGNSDVHGFVANLDECVPGWDGAGGRALVLGAGGAAHSTTYALLHRGFTVALVNRTFEHARDLADRFGPKVSAHMSNELASLLPSADLLVNCTSCGMQGKPPLAVDIAPLKRSAVACDLVYVPLETTLLADARRRGHRVVDGLGMLLRQAGFGFEKWFGVMPAVTRDLRGLVEADIRARTPRA